MYQEITGVFFCEKTKLAMLFLDTGSSSRTVYYSNLENPSLIKNKSINWPYSYYDVLKYNENGYLYIPTQYGHGPCQNDRYYYFDEEEIQYIGYENLRINHYFDVEFKQSFLLDIGEENLYYSNHSNYSSQTFDVSLKRLPVTSITTEETTITTINMVLPVTSLIISLIWLKRRSGRL